jgi:ribosomal protein S18 acetylase RimI-like enzyme
METSGTERNAGGINTGPIKITRSSLGDLPQLVAISQAAIYAARWTEQQWRDIFHTQNPRRLAWMAWASGDPPNRVDEASGGSPAGRALLSATPDVGRYGAASPVPIGFLVAQCGGAEWEVENMAVLPSFRRLGAGSALLATLVAEAQLARAERVLLEVRPSNRPAIRLYEQANFVLLARRPGYYQDPVEDALIMVRAL